MGRNRWLIPTHHTTGAVDSPQRRSVYPLTLHHVYTRFPRVIHIVNNFIPISNPGLFHDYSTTHPQVIHIFIHHFHTVFPPFIHKKTAVPDWTLRLTPPSISVGQTTYQP